MTEQTQWVKLFSNYLINYQDIEHAFIISSDGRRALYLGSVVVAVPDEHYMQPNTPFTAVHVFGPDCSSSMLDFPPHTLFIALWSTNLLSISSGSNFLAINLISLEFIRNIWKRCEKDSYPYSKALRLKKLANSRE